MLLSILTTLALATTPTISNGLPAAHVTISQSAQVIGCHPQPGKVMGCVSNSHEIAQQRAMGTFQPAVALADGETASHVVACHPDPSRNRGCFRPAPGATMVKPAMAAKAAATPAATAEADHTPTQPSDASRKNS